MQNRARMEDRVPVADEAARDITTWLNVKEETRRVRNVEGDREFRKRDIDLVWETDKGEITIEIKGDTYHRTGNFFLETLSNQERNTPGCFMYTEADFVFYYFVTIKKLYILPMPETRDWFREHLGEFRERATETEIGNGEHYTTVGRLVPIATLLANVPTIEVCELGGA